MKVILFKGEIVLFGKFYSLKNMFQPIKKPHLFRFAIIHKVLDVKNSHNFTRGCRLALFKLQLRILSNKWICCLIPCVKSNFQFLKTLFPCFNSPPSPRAEQF